MFRVANLRKDYGERIVLDGISFSLGQGDRVGLVGQNGCGKSTLLKILAGIVESDAGSVSFFGYIKLAYLPQHMDEELELTVGQFLAPEAYQAARSMRQIEARMAVENLDLAELYTAAFDAFEAAGGYTTEARIESTLSGLGMGDVSLERPLGSLSGGQRTRLALARVLILDADIMLLDEPTNNLDVSALEWLEQRLLDSSAATIVVSHDRKFLDRVTNKTFELDRMSGRLTEYGGNYSLYRQVKQEKEDRQWRQYREQQERVQQLTADIRSVRQQAMKTETSTQDDFYRGRAKKFAAVAKGRETRLNRMISEENRVEKPRTEEAIRLRFSKSRTHRVKLMEALNVSIQRSGITVLNDINLEVYSGERIALSGGNGSGKSSLLEFLCNNLSSSSGALFQRPDLKLGYLPQHQESLPEKDNVLNYFMAGQHDLSNGAARTFLHAFLFKGEEVFKTISSLSRGERTRLILATFMAREPDLLVLDEPTNHLDVRTIECLERALKEYKGALIVVSHDRYFLEQLNPDTYWIAEKQSIATVLAAGT